MDLMGYTVQKKKKKKKKFVVYLKFKFNWEPCVYFLIFINWPCHRTCGILVP